MLKRKNRVPRALFSETFAKSQATHSTFFTIRSKRNKVPGHRVSVIVSSKVAKRAVDRNLLRRRTYAILDELIPKNSSLTILCFAKKGATQLDFQGLKTNLQLGLNKLSS